MKKKMLSVIVALVLVVSLISSAAATATKPFVYTVNPDNAVTITLDGEKLELKNAADETVVPILIDGTTYLPVRSISETLGVGVDWIQSGREVALSDNITMMKLSYTDEKTNVTTSTDVYVYTPDTFTPDGNLKPVLLVYGDEDYNMKTVMTEVENSGFGKIAAAEGCNVVFVNSAGDTWDEVDMHLYTKLINSNNHDYGAVDGYNNGKVSFNEQQVHIFAEGRGADFASKYLSNEDLRAWLDWAYFEYTPTTVTLFNSSIAPTLSKDHMFGYTYAFPAMIVNGTKEMETAFKATCTDEDPSVAVVYSKTSKITDGFDPALVQESWDKLGSKMIRRVYGGASGMKLEPINDYAAAGISVTTETMTLSTGDITYTAFIGKDLDMTEKGAVPLVMTFHGRGESSWANAQYSGWPMLGKEKGFITVSVDQHGSQSPDAIVELLENLLFKYPVIDKSRVYASGFSMGAGKSISLGFGSTKHFAGIAPMDAPANIVRDLTESGQIIPAFFVAGHNDMMIMFPHQVPLFETEPSLDADKLYSTVFARNNIGKYVYSKDAKTRWGMDGFSSEYSVEDGPMTLNVRFLKSQDGNVYTALCDVENQGHNQTKQTCIEAWKFLSQFARNEDGSIRIIKK